MKKYLSIFVMLFTLFISSCSNDDIPVNKSITFKINPSTVVSSYKELEPGELSSIPSGANLRMRLLIYNESGKLVAEDETFMNDYTHIMTTSVNLAGGNYIAVACTDVVLENKEFEFWNISGKENISTTTFTDTGYIGGPYKILGLKVHHFSVDDNTKEQYIDVKPAGALALVHWTNWRRYSNVEDFRLYANRTCDNMTLNSLGEPHYSIQSSDDVGSWRIASVSYDSDYSGAYVYVFLFPVRNMTVQFGASLTNGRYTLFDNARAIIDIELGKEYYFVYDVKSEECQWLVLTDVDAQTPSSELRYSENSTTSKELDNQKSIKLMDFVEPGILHEVK